MKSLRNALQRYTASQFFGALLAALFAQLIGAVFYDVAWFRIALSGISGAVTSGIIGVYQRRQPPIFRVAKNTVTNEYRIEVLESKGIAARFDSYRKYGHLTYRSEQEARYEALRETHRLLADRSWEGINEATN